MMEVNFLSSNVNTFGKYFKTLAKKNDQPTTQKTKETTTEPNLVVNEVGNVFDSIYDYKYICAGITIALLLLYIFVLFRLYRKNKLIVKNAILQQTKTPPNLYDEKKILIEESSV